MTVTQLVWCCTAGSNQNGTENSFHVPFLDECNDGGMIETVDPVKTGFVFSVVSVNYFCPDSFRLQTVKSAKSVSLCLT